MAASPKFKVYKGTDYRAALKHVEDAAILVAVLGKGSTIRIGHAARDIMWYEGGESQSAAESYDHVAKVVYDRLSARRAKREAARPLPLTCKREAGHFGGCDPFVVNTDGARPTCGLSVAPRAGAHGGGA